MLCHLKVCYHMLSLFFSERNINNIYNYCIHHVVKYVIIILWDAYMI